MLLTGTTFPFRMNSSWNLNSMQLFSYLCQKYNSQLRLKFSDRQKAEKNVIFKRLKLYILQSGLMVLLLTENMAKIKECWNTL